LGQRGVEEKKVKRLEQGKIGRKMSRKKTPSSYLVSEPITGKREDGEMGMGKTGTKGETESRKSRQKHRKVASTGLLFIGRTGSL